MSNQNLFFKNLTNWLNLNFTSLTKTQLDCYQLWLSLWDWFWHKNSAKKSHKKGSKWNLWQLNVWSHKKSFSFSSTGNKKEKITQKYFKSINNYCQLIKFHMITTQLRDFPFADFAYLNFIRKY